MKLFKSTEGNIKSILTLAEIGSDQEGEMKTGDKLQGNGHQ